MQVRFSSNHNRVPHTAYRPAYALVPELDPRGPKLRTPERELAYAYGDSPLLHRKAS